ncbi:MAG: sugar porter family MFS transporter [Candidatus Thermoplasmatota archaeon]|nr:sugar porter family MFS transporter [Candidatus Thermoplasmatota archaeon]MCL5731570.1 sugar porter family MFS transporter [Candidatus Thermoplasmatota archaeon]
MASDQEHSNQTVLDRLDTGKTSGFFWLLTLLATIGGFLFGYDTSNIGIVQGFLPVSYTSTNPFITGYLFSGVSLGAAVGALLAASLIDRYGRKSMLIFDALLYSIGAILSALTVDLFMLLASRTIIGIAVGADSAIATAYISEWAPKNRRGSLSILQQWMITVGILGAYMFGLAVLYSLPSMAYSEDWRIMLGIAAIPSIIGLAFRFVMPESPRWLVLKGKYRKAVEALKKLGVDTNEDELRLQFPAGHTTKARMSPGVKRAFLVVGLFMVFQQITGINIPFYYGPKIISSLHIFSSGTSAVSAEILAVEAASILAVVNVAATYIGFRLIDKAGRRTLAIFGYSGMAIFAIVGALFKYDGMDVAMLVSLAIFIVFFAFGVGGTGWIIQGEYFPTEYRGSLASMIAFIDWISNFAIIEIFPYMDDRIHIAGSLLVFGLLSVVAALTFYFIMPVTKGKSVEEITKMFENLK